MSLMVLAATIMECDTSWLQSAAAPLDAAKSYTLDLHRLRQLINADTFMFKPV